MPVMIPNRCPSLNGLLPTDRLETIIEYPLGRMLDRLIEDVRKKRDGGKTEL
jgi:hypothetical protein